MSAFSLDELLRVAGVVGAQLPDPAPRRFIGSEQALLDSPRLVAHLDDLDRERARMRRLMKRAAMCRPPKPRYGVVRLDGERMPEGWMARELLSLLCAQSALSSELSEKTNVLKKVVEGALRHLHSKKLADWAATDLPWRPRRWSITQAGRDALEVWKI